jgi:hypothetical protein
MNFDKELAEQAAGKLTEPEYDALSMREFACGISVGFRKAKEDALAFVGGLAADAFLGKRDEHARWCRDLIDKLKDLKQRD